MYVVKCKVESRKGGAAMRLRVKVRLERIGLVEREKENEGKEFVCPSRVSVVRLREIVRGKKYGIDAR